MADPSHTPRGDGIFLDHLAHWVPDLDAAAAVLEQMGFLLTPATAHSHSPHPGAPREPAGTTNRCVMLREGYLEILAAEGDTPVSREVRAALERHTGVHLAALCVNEPAAERERLLAQGFPQRPLVALEREAEMADGTIGTLRFTVIRPEAGSLPEGRVQFLGHETPDRVWQERWLRQPNGVTGLTDLLFCVDDVEECARRYARYLRTDARPAPGGARVLAFQRGALTIMTPDAARAALGGLEPPRAPCMAGYGLRAPDLDTARRRIERSGVDCRPAGSALALALPPALGAIAVLHRDGVPWRR